MNTPNNVNFEPMHSDNINEIMTALSKAQGSRDNNEESKQVARMVHLICKDDWKLNQVNEIREEHKKGGVTQKQLSKKHKVSPMTINRIVNFITWK